MPLAQYKRVAVPVCMVPRKCASPEALKERRIVFDEGRAAQHEPHLVVPHPSGDKFVYALPSSQFTRPELVDGTANATDARCVLYESSVASTSLTSPKFFFSMSAP